MISAPFQEAPLEIPANRRFDRFRHHVCRRANAGKISNRKEQRPCRTRGQHRLHPDRGEQFQVPDAAATTSGLLAVAGVGGYRSHPLRSDVTLWIAAETVA